jgi:cysteine desulfurase
MCNGPGNVRDSLHRETTAGDVDRFLAELPDLVTRLRAEAGMVGWRPLTRTVRP